MAKVLHHHPVRRSGHVGFERANLEERNSNICYDARNRLPE